MSILIEGMEMPKRGEMLVVIKPNGETKYKNSLANSWDDAFSASIPTPHGWLIDADEFVSDLIFPNKSWELSFNAMVNDAPTVIEAEE